MALNVATACRDINELSTLAQTACKLFLATCKARGINIFITETYRSQDRQDYLYAQGRTREGNVVTWTRSSRHTSRRAWDIACNGNVLYDKAMIRKAGAVAAELGITWGGTWSTPDMPHFEIVENWKAPVEKTPTKKEDTEMVEQAQVKINGKIYTVDRILKDGTNYIKARDFEKAGFVISNEGNMAVITTK